MKWVIYFSLSQDSHGVSSWGQWYPKDFVHACKTTSCVTERNVFPRRAGNHGGVGDGSAGTSNPPVYFCLAGGFSGAFLIPAEVCVKSSLLVLHAADIQKHSETSAWVNTRCFWAAPEVCCHMIHEAQVWGSSLVSITLKLLPLWQLPARMKENPGMRGAMSLHCSLAERGLRSHCFIRCALMLVAGLVWSGDVKSMGFVSNPIHFHWHKLVISLKPLHPVTQSWNNSLLQLEPHKTTGRLMERAPLDEKSFSRGGF